MNIRQIIRKPRYITVTIILSFLYSVSMYYWRYGFENSPLIRIVLMIARFFICSAFILFAVIPLTRLSASKAFASDCSKEQISRRKALIRNCLIFAVCWLCSLFRSRKSLIYYVPLIATMLIVMAAPANQGFPRYLFPVVYMAPLLFIDYLKESLTD